MKIALIENLSLELFNARTRYAQYLIKQGHEVVAIVPNDGYEKRIEKAGIKVITLNLNIRSINAKAYLSYWRQLYRIFNEECFDVVHFFKMPPNLIGTSAAFFSKGKKVIVNHITGLGLAFGSKAPKYLVIRNIIRFVFFINANFFGAKLIYQNEGNRRTVGVLKNSRVITGSTANEGLFNKQNTIKPSEARKQFGLPEHPTLLFVSRLLKEKGLAYLVGAIKKFNTTQSRKFNLIIVGWVDLDNPGSFTQEEIDDLAADKHIVSLGKRSDVAEIYDAAEIAVLTTAYPEGTPRSLLEGMAKSKAVLTSRIDGCDHLVDELKSGFLVRPNNQLDILEALELFSVSNLEEMGQLSWDIYQKKFSEKVIFSQFLAAYH
jgi:glycosyltransferase involved in cell wall biosynthesis